MNYEEAKKIAEGYKVSLAVEGLSISDETEEIGIKIAMGEISADEAISILDKKRGLTKNA